MTIESVIKNLTDAINANTEAIKNTAVPPAAVPPAAVPPATAPPAAVPPAAVPPAAVPPAAVPPATAPPAAAPPAAGPALTATITPEELNTVLVAEFTRLNDRTGIDAVLKEFGVSGVTELPANQYQSLIDKVKAL